jgi:hypothetical protein
MVGWEPSRLNEYYRIDISINQSITNVAAFTKSAIGSVTNFSGLSLPGTSVIPASPSRKYSLLTTVVVIVMMMILNNRKKMRERTHTGSTKEMR